MGTVTIKINSKSDIGKYLIGLAKELAKNSKAILIEDDTVINNIKNTNEFIESLSKKTNKNLTEKLFAKHNISYTN